MRCEKQNMQPNVSGKMTLFLNFILFGTVCHPISRPVLSFAAVIAPEDLQGHGDNKEMEVQFQNWHFVGLTNEHLDSCIHLFAFRALIA
eukprot:4490076-Amphidinium_carterae.1